MLNLLIGGATPTPIEQPCSGAGCAFLRNAFCRAGGPTGREKRSALFFLPGGLRLLLLCFLAQQTIHIGLDGQQLPYLVPCLSVIGVDGFFLRQQSGVLGLETLDRGQLFQSQTVKGFLRRLMQKYLALMLCPERLLYHVILVKNNMA